MTKTITIRTEVYEKLIRIKKEDESFSELFERLAAMLAPMDALLKLRGSMEFANKDRMLAEILSKRSEVRQ
ncbi:MAG: antitoxin VapB family protein [Candidatus Marsarchaeota archaeon]|jgi:predicted CopG family antitoxin|nr:antitoxin VapB family protein [Candidatus Marsarchaeota archaeon]